MKSEELADKYPSVELAYGFAIDSYKMAVSRHDAMESRLQNLVSLAATLTLAVPVIVKTLDLEISGGWLFLILGTFGSIVALGTYGRLVGTMKVVDPSVLFDEFLHCSEWEFKKDFIYWAGVNYKSNRELIEKKWKIAAGVSILLFLEAAWVALWVFYLP